MDGLVMRRPVSAKGRAFLGMFDDRARTEIGCGAVIDTPTGPEVLIRVGGGQAVKMHALRACMTAAADEAAVPGAGETRRLDAARIWNAAQAALQAMSDSRAEAVAARESAGRRRVRAL